MLNAQTIYAKGKMYLLMALIQTTSKHSQLAKRHEYTLYKNIHKIAVYKPVAISRIEAYILSFEQIKNAFLQ